MRTWFRFCALLIYVVVGVLVCRALDTAETRGHLE